VFTLPKHVAALRALRATRAKIERPQKTQPEIRFIHRRKGALMATAVATPSINTNVASFITKKRQMLINGKWVDSASGKTFSTYNPATGEVLANVAEGDREDIDRAVKAARAAFETGKWSKTSPAARARMMWKLADLLEQHLEEFAQISPSKIFATTPDGPPRSKATPSRSAARLQINSSPTRCANLSASSAKSSRGISRS
jgi:delta 1-pyrroline-5-carboxylate dehydrogenase